MGWGGVGPFEAALDTLPWARGQRSLRPTSWWWSSPLPHPQDTEGLGWGVLGWTQACGEAPIWGWGVVMRSEEGRAPGHRPEGPSRSSPRTLTPSGSALSPQPRAVY